MRDKHPLAGTTVRLKLKASPKHPPAAWDGAEYHIEDWWVNVYGASWKYAEGNPAALDYAMRNGFSGLPLDDEVVYGKVGSFGKLVHVSELGEVLEPVK